ncbi:MAG TPA: hypothetical protein VKI65_00255, partial [Gemmataceae bacterium]|nr:hypothetical protein [Gemmataceae bacterium]
AFRQRMIDDLRSPSPRKKRRALFVVADLFDDPFGIFAWKLPTHLDNSQVETLAALHRTWLFPCDAESRRVRRQLVEEERQGKWARDAGGLAERRRHLAVPHQVWRRLVKHCWEALRQWGKSEEAEPEPLPPADGGELLAALQEQMETALGDLADAINAASDEETLAQAAAGLGRYFEGIERKAVEIGRRLRQEAAAAGVPAADRDWGEDSHTDRESRLQSLVEQAQEKLTQAADAFKDALLDLGITEPPVPRHPSVRLEPLPAMARIEFVEALRSEAGETLLQVARVLNTSPAAEIGIRQTELIHNLFAALCWRALEMGLTMRLLAWEDSLQKCERVSRHEGKVYPLRKAADPPLPPSQVSRLRWAEKYRRMRAAEACTAIIAGLRRGHQD